MKHKIILGLCELLEQQGFENSCSIYEYVIGLENENKKLKTRLENCNLNYELFQKEKLKVDKITRYCHERLGFLENCNSNDDTTVNEEIVIYNDILSMLENEEK